MTCVAASAWVRPGGSGAESVHVEWGNAEGLFQSRVMSILAAGRPEARCLSLSESEEKRGSDVIPKCALCNGSKDES